MLNSSAYQCPDEQYSVESRKIPGVVVEVAFSQSIKNLSAKAINYLTLSNGCILVIGLDASYCIKIHCLNLHLWMSLTTHVKKEIRNGNHINSGALAIPLRTFGPTHALAVKYPAADLDTRAKDFNPV